MTRLARLPRARGDLAGDQRQHRRVAEVEQRRRSTRKPAPGLRAAAGRAFQPCRCGPVRDRRDGGGGPDRAQRRGRRQHERRGEVEHRDLRDKGADRRPSRRRRSRCRARRSGRCGRAARQEPARPTSARLMAAIAAGSMQLAKPCSTSATSTGSHSGCIARISALPPMATHPASAASRLLASASTSAPPGNWLTMPATVPMLSAAPILPWVQACAAEIDGDEGAEAGLHVGDEEIVPVEPAPGRAHRAGITCRKSAFRARGAAPPWSLAGPAAGRRPCSPAMALIWSAVMSSRMWSAAPRAGSAARARRRRCGGCRRP